MLLDDDSNTLIVLRALLERTTANVIDCEDEKCALQRCQERLSGIDLLVADVVLQGASNGPAVARRIRPLQPLIRLLFISGFSLKELERRGLLQGQEIDGERVQFLQKPFTPDLFLGAVKKLLNE